MGMLDVAIAVHFVWGGDDEKSNRGCRQRNSNCRIPVKKDVRFVDV